MTEAQVHKLVAVLAASFPAARGDAGTIAAYQRMLADLDYPAANAAVERLIATSKRLPTVAEVRDAVLALTAGEARNGGEAWGDVLKAIRRYGYMRTPGVDFHFDDPVVANTVRALSWQELCSSENAVADRARFIETYDQLAVRHRRAQLSDGLPAMQRFRALQASQQQAELAAGEAVPIGDLVKQVLKRGDR
jgi:hypothetical protein